MANEILMPPTLSSLITAMCADYSRRGEVIEERCAPFNVIMEYRFLNYRIMNAAIEIAGERDALAFISDIGERRGHSSSSIYISESLYKTRKKEVRENIAKRLSLI